MIVVAVEGAKVVVTPTVVVVGAIEVALAVVVSDGDEGVPDVDVGPSVVLVISGEVLV